MSMDFIKGLLLIALGVVSVWLFYTLGETDVTGCILVIMLGVCQVCAAVPQKQKSHPKNERGIKVKKQRGTAAQLKTQKNRRYQN